MCHECVAWRSSSLLCEIALQKACCLLGRASDYLRLYIPDLSMYFFGTPDGILVPQVCYALGRSIHSSDLRRRQTYSEPRRGYRVLAPPAFCPGCERSARRVFPGSGLGSLGRTSRCLGPVRRGLAAPLCGALRE